MANHSDRFMFLIHASYEFLGLLEHAQRIGIERAPRQHDGIELPRLGLIQRLVHRNLVAFIVMMHPLNVALMWRDYCGNRAGLFQDLLRLDQLGLFEPIGSKDRHVHSLDVPFRHIPPPILVSPLIVPLSS